MEFEHKKFGKCVLKEITQKQLEAFSADMKGLDMEPLTVWHGAGVRSFIRHSILVEPVMAVVDVDNAKPALVRWLSNCISKAVAEATNIDPLS